MNGVVIFTIAVFLDWATPEGEEAGFSGYESDSLLPFPHMAGHLGRTRAPTLPKCSCYVRPDGAIRDPRVGAWLAILLVLGTVSGR